MGWNYETGKEEPNAYSNPSSGIYTPPPMGSAGLLMLQVAWEAAEAKLRACHITRRATRDELNIKAMLCFNRLEIAIVQWEKAAQVPEFRTRFIEFLRDEAKMKAGVKATADAQIEDIDLNVLPIFDRIIQAGYRDLAKKTHPDVGGDPKEFQKLTKAKQKLAAVLAEIRSELE